MPQVQPLQPQSPDHSGERWSREFRLLVGDILRECLDDAPMKWEEVAERMGVESSLLSHWCSAERTPLPADRIPDLVRAIGPSFLRRIAKECGFNIIRLSRREAE